VPEQRVRVLVLVPERPERRAQVAQVQMDLVQKQSDKQPTQSRKCKRQVCER